MKRSQQTKLAALFFALALVAGGPFCSAAADTSTKARSILLAEFKLDGVTLPEAVHQLQIAAKRSNPGKGVNFMVTKSATTAASPKITLALKEVTVKEAAERLAKAAGVSMTAQDYALVFDAKKDKP
jgi:hypothetical protein